MPPMPGKVTFSPWHVSGGRGAPCEVTCGVASQVLTSSGEEPWGAEFLEELLLCPQRHNCPAVDVDCACFPLASGREYHRHTGLG